MSDQSLRFLVTGASGQLGALVVDALLARHPASEIGALVRRPEAAAPLEAKGVTVRVASYTDPAALEAALAGVERLLLVSSNEVGQRAPQHRNVIDAAEAAGVGFVAYTSLLHADSSPLNILAGEHRATEAMLAESGLPHAILRNSWYTENNTAAVPTALQYGTLMGAAGEGRISGATRADYAEAAAVVLGEARTGTFELAGDTSYSLAEFAAEISARAGKPVAYAPMDQAAYKDALVGAGLPEPVADMLADSDAGAAQGGLEDNSKTLSGLIGRPTTPWQDTVAQAVAAQG